MLWNLLGFVFYNIKCNIFLDVKVGMVAGSWVVVWWWQKSILDTTLNIQGDVYRKYTLFKINFSDLICFFFFKLLK